MSGKLILLGGGHAHVRMLQLIKGRGRLPDCEVCLISPFERSYHPQMIGGYVEGSYQEAELCFDLPGLCRMAKIDFRQGIASEIDPVKKIVCLADGAELAYDWLSLNIGAGLTGADLPGIKENAILCKPEPHLIALPQRLNCLESCTAPVVIVGDTQVGVEVAFAVQEFIQQKQQQAAVTIVLSGDLPMPGYPLHMRRRMEQLIKSKGITLVTGQRVAQATGQEIIMQDGSKLAFSLLLWATGPESPQLFRKSRLPVDEQGYLRVNRLLFCSDYPEIFGAGDCTVVEGITTRQKTSCHPAHEAAVLTHNLRVAMETPRFKLFKPHKNIFRMLSLGGRVGLLCCAGFCVSGHWCWQLKDWIDRRFVRRHQP